MTSAPATSTTATASQHSNVVPSEVGWQFVPQYYGFVNKEPHRLHCFYSKNSTFVHGTEGEESKPCYGQTEIHKKITSIGFDNCKVFIHSVDTQASAGGGIIIQVIGEMSNHGDAWRKFVQTFFLAEQPNGYFVLNDIFRFLKEETVEGDDAASDSAEPAAEIPAISPSAPAAPPVPEPVAPVAVAPPPPVEPEPVIEQPREPTPAPPAPAPVEPEPPAPVEEAPKAAEAPVPAVQEPKQTPTPAPEPAVPSPSSTHPNGHAAEPDKPAAPPAEALAKPAPSPKPSTPAPSVTAPAPPSQPSAPSAPRSWASLAATNQKKWGSVAQDSKAVSESVSMPTTGAPASVAAQTPAPSGPPAQSRPPQQQQQQQPRGDHPTLIAAQSVNTPQVFVKGVIEPVSQTHLINTLTSRFGPVKDVEIVRQKACAFLEFTTLDAARRAIIASLPPSQGGEGGVRVEVGGGAQPVRITVETKKEKADRPPSRPHRGGAPPQINGGHGAPQGGFRGRGGPRGGRGGGAPQK